MKQKIVLIGASTGGPSQIKELIRSLQSLDYTIVIVQHMREEVLPFFIKDIQDSTHIDIQTTPLKTDFSSPSIIICSHSCILTRRCSAYEFEVQTQGQSYTPDINKLFNSFVEYAEMFDLKVIIMTGIGRDGVDGAMKLKAKGAYVVAQDELSSPVFGMPKAAIESGIVDAVQSKEEIKEYLKGL